MKRGFGPSSPFIMINIFDGCNVVRRDVEADPTGHTPRTFFTKFLGNPETNIFVWDGVRCNERRRKLFPNYKVWPSADKDIFVNFDIVKKVLRHTSVIQVEVPGYEADDIIATLTRRWARGGSEVAIHSNDRDYLQLAGEFPNRVFCGILPKAGMPPEHIRLYKTFVGDPSDKIPGIAGFGDGAWLQVGPDGCRAVLEEVLEKGHVGQLPTTWPKRAKLDPDLLKIFWTITGFYDVPSDLIDAGMTAGKPDAIAGDNFLKEFFE